MCVGLIDHKDIKKGQAQVRAIQSCMLAQKQAATESMENICFRRINRTISENRPAVQVGDPFMEKLLLEACLELNPLRCTCRDSGYGCSGTN